MKPPSILFCLADDAGMHFGAYGCRWVSTPAFDRVAREGILFRRGYTPNAKYGSGARLGGRRVDEIDRVPEIWPDNEIVRNDLLDYGFEIAVEEGDKDASRQVWRGNAKDDDDTSGFGSIALVETMQ